MKSYGMAGVAVVLLAVLGGCATPDARILELQQKQTLLLNQTKVQDQKIQSLLAEQARLNQELNYFIKRAKVLEKEKNERMQESKSLRTGIRQFTDDVMKSLREQYKKTEIVDYVGSEVCVRQSTVADAGQLLIDMEHPLPADGTLIGLRAYVLAPTRVQFCLLRHSREKGKLVVVDLSKELTASKAGAQFWSFDVPVAVQKGDLVAVYSPEAVQIPYDDADTGNVALVPGSVKINGTVPPIPSPSGRNRRAFSFGVVGFME